MASLITQVSPNNYLIPGQRIFLFAGLGGLTATSLPIVTVYATPYSGINYIVHSDYQSSFTIPSMGGSLPATATINISPAGTYTATTLTANTYPQVPIGPPSINYRTTHPTNTEWDYIFGNNFAFSTSTYVTYYKNNSGTPSYTPVYTIVHSLNQISIKKQSSGDVITGLYVNNSVGQGSWGTTPT